MSDADPTRPWQAFDLGDLSVAQLLHDLRNQLTVMMGCAENLVPLVAHGEAEQHLTELRQCVERASQLSRRLLSAVRPQGARRRVDLNEAVAMVLRSLAPSVSDRFRVELYLSVAAVPVFAEVSELERIVLNLSLNARDAMGGEGLLRIETAIVGDPSGSRGDGIGERPHAQLTITDTGTGLTPEAKLRMFEPFFTTKETGTGLGLSSVAFTVRQLGGTILVDTQPGHGTSISVILPLALEH
jgi:two-component system, cell cycle sensor histidine kinase and response regulator CckA